jgi:hypothetical protein
VGSLSGFGQASALRLGLGASLLSLVDERLVVDVLRPNAKEIGACQRDDGNNDG